MKQAIVGYHKDAEDHWVAELTCGHNQHVRHKPPWVVRHWVTTEMGRAAMWGYKLDCKLCESREGKEPVALSDTGVRR
ncbi:DUF3565 domain-containing protein [Gilvimarinus xylanilyticus]|uniref:DUF3565 domain-containing protein n=1 Tax=Gilvimarinus xylanilyticus TaxID=2944139 RepID=A0A9X2I2A3_9GAMM|nr:DUF3565 domain-containing protein [Gilvimarinus xylanilyticus]MCP8899015.1 DUF3565 domain-containing protein [Gilvimarinus xylanilyticus]